MLQKKYATLHHLANNEKEYGAFFFIFKTSLQKQKEQKVTLIHFLLINLERKNSIGGIMKRILLYVI